MNYIKKNRIIPRFITLICVRLLLGDVPASTSAFLSSTRVNEVNNRASRDYRRIPALAVSVSNDHDLRNQLETMKVKELRDVLKLSTLNERGILTRLKRKKDLVDFLNENLDASELQKLLTYHSQETEEDESNDTFKNTGSRPISMPNQSGKASQTGLSPKDALFEKIYDLYPPLREQECFGIGESDIRQTYHPIFRDAKVSSDMDLIFVGTASCSPGMTRGVSCTALRLNGNVRRSLRGLPQSNDDFESFSGGTWLFDCGECTQVSLEL